MTMTTTTSLADQLAALGLRATAAQLDDLIARATTHRWSTTQLLEHVVQSELDERARHGLARRRAARRSPGPRSARHPPRARALRRPRDLPGDSS